MAEPLTETYTFRLTQKQLQYLTRAANHRRQDKSEMLRAILQALLEGASIVRQSAGKTAQM